MSGTPLDFNALDTNELTKLTTAVHAVAAYAIENKEVRESVAETLDSLVAELKADKDSAKYVKKFVRKAAATYANNKTADLRYENEIVEMLLDSATKRSIEED